MSAMGHEQTSRNVPVMSVIPSQSGHSRGWHVHLVPLANSAIAEQPRFYRERTYAADAV